ncbi:MAG TPA: hypothetical protein VGO21_02730 [Candidatus Paceibacterota bacterium]|jgi:hypothetical protein|nr:hypothetical protein [Candidatus Paceibacterota bacterium]
MQTKAIQKLLTRLNKEDEEISGAVVFDLKKGTVIASTFSKEYVKKTIEIEQLIADLEKRRIMKLDPCGSKNWAMYSFNKKIVATVRIKKDIFISLEYVMEKAPSASIEDALEVALMVNELI